ncbi:hypothetical protein [Lactobacillus taiwanensis]|uniref:hypothetical protein n=1 Tax=Lactobacillus taiwanensis TaxID=508451 RepID=UPI00164CD7BA|nr:hypothetical protein [Lactobacillus taiwanensis]
MIFEGTIYAFELGVGAYCTMSGLGVNRKNQVLNKKGRPIMAYMQQGAMLQVF